jgi:hypothetical protein
MSLIGLSSKERCADRRKKVTPHYTDKALLMDAPSPLLFRSARRNCLAFHRTIALRYSAHDSGNLLLNLINLLLCLLLTLV